MKLHKANKIEHLLKYYQILSPISKPGRKYNNNKIGI